MDLPIPPNTTDLDRLELEKLDERLILKDKKWYIIMNGIEYEYNNKQKRWIELNDDDDDDDDLNKQDIKKLKKDKLSEIKKEVNELKGFKKQSSGVFISNLPKTNITELEDLFTKYGKIKEDGIKLYYDGEKFKGEALVVYTNHESCDIAIEMLDHTKYKNQIIKVEIAKFSNEPRLLIKNMFRKLDDQLKEDIITDLNEEVSLLVDNSHLLDIKFKNETIILKFDDLQSCEMVNNKFNNRYYDGLKLETKII
ncbi:unnamed protein product [Candida verbasci]|uniref:RRM domain-containing protein n=1 Tax=Candida verbasci TaxID=1227364 RepID=A0A9W4XCM4_9ASCO|nr:unnamed protein product [Candida verbasci]